MTKQNQALFTKLTPEQAAVIEGGLRVRLYSLEVIQTGADTITGDDPLVRVNGSTLFSEKDVNANDILEINNSIDLGNVGTVRIEMSDDDDFLNGNDDLIGINTFTGPGIINKLFQNDVSAYILKGEILA
ncbi:hypothetical protein [Pleurocapsa sp. PCC 7319]|uniref:hypothetical protein n=1 Tax=Pleurocapsa sp. PCC 7319 TaxID=118161 RepID=UPI00034538F6|nr:hypothetical protein [Pleurocapsa sp. PCC 7319]